MRANKKGEEREREREMERVGERAKKSCEKRNRNKQCRHNGNASNIINEMGIKQIE